MAPPREIPLIATLILAIPAGAAAQPAREPSQNRQQVTVSVADLKLETPAGQRIARARLARAAVQVCGPAPSHLADLEHMEVFNACSRQALQDAEQQLFKTQSLQQGSGVSGQGDQPPGS